MCGGIKMVINNRKSRKNKRNQETKEAKLGNYLIVTQYTETEVSFFCKNTKTTESFGVFSYVR